ncbi:hypothetical protein ACHWQZ_G017502 [Mnemiopsis leidyi]
MGLQSPIWVLLRVPSPPVILSVRCRLMLSAGISAVGIINLLAGFLEKPEYMWALWGLNGLCSGACWPAIGCLIVSNFPEHKRGRIWSLVSGSMNAGSTLSPILADFLVHRTSWNTSFMLIGIVDLLIGAVLFILLPEESSSINPTDKTDPNTPVSSPWSWDILLNKFMFSVCLSQMIVTFSLISFSTWGQMLFIEKLGTDTLTAGIMVSVYEIGGFCGSTTSGFLADYVARTFKTRSSPRAYPGILCCGISCVSVAALQFLTPSYIVCRVCAFGSGFGFYGTMAMYGLLTREYVSREHAGTLTAVMVVCSQVGGFCAGSPLAEFYENHQISDGFWIVSSILPVAFVCMTVLTMVDGQYKEKRE